MDFSSNISKILNIRILELSYVLTSIQDYSGKDGEITSIRSGVVMLYSHWEGFIKNSGELTQKRIKNVKNPLKHCKKGFILNTFIKKENSLFLFIKIFLLHIQLKDGLQLRDIPFDFSTEDNLSFPIFKEKFLKYLCINQDEFYRNVETNILNSATFPTDFIKSGKLYKVLVLDNNKIIKSNFVSYDHFAINSIKVLLFLRNNISHGDHEMSISILEYTFLYESVKSFLIAYKDILIDFFENSKYLK